jgi:hypothetical protein
MTRRDPISVVYRYELSDASTLTFMKRLGTLTGLDLAPTEQQLNEAWTEHKVFFTFQPKVDRYAQTCVLEARREYLGKTHEQEGPPFELSHCTYVMVNLIEPKEMQNPGWEPVTFAPWVLGLLPSGKAVAWNASPGIINKFLKI